MSFEIRRNIQEQVKHAQSILIPLPESYWKESLGSALSFGYVAQAMGKSVSILLPQGVALPSIEGLPMDLVTDFFQGISDTVISLDTQRYPVKELKYEQNEQSLQIFLTPELRNILAESLVIQSGGYQYDLVVTFNSTSFADIGSWYTQYTEFFEQTPSIAFTRTPVSASFAQIHWDNAEVSGTAEMMYKMIKESYQPYLSPQVVTALLFGLVAETDNFQLPQANPRTFLTAAELMERGAKRESLIEYLYPSRSLSGTRLLGRILAHLSYEEVVVNGQTHQIVYSKLYGHDFEKTETTKDDVYQVMQELPQILDLQSPLIHIMIEGSAVKEGLIAPGAELSSQSLSTVLDGELYRGIFRYSYPSPHDVHQACSEVNQIIARVLQGSQSSGDLVQ